MPFGFAGSGAITFGPAPNRALIFRARANPRQRTGSCWAFRPRASLAGSKLRLPASRQGGEIGFGSLAQSTAARAPSLPEAPTFQEAGIHGPGFGLSSVCLGGKGRL